MEAKNCPQIEEELEPKWEKPKTTSDTKSKNLLVLLMKTENQVPKFGNTPTTINTKTVKPKFFGTKPIYKNDQHRKTKNPNAPFLTDTTILTRLYQGTTKGRSC